MGNARGVKELNAFEDGKKLTLKQSVLAKCAECSCNYIDGKVDCKIPECPLYPFMVYGSVWKGRAKKIVSPLLTEHRLSGLKKARMRRTTTPI